MATEYIDKISFDIEIEDVRKKIIKHLAVIGKRAKDVQGKSMFSDITVSSAEESVFDDLIKSGAETIVNELNPFCGMYDGASNLTFTITAKRWTDTDATTAEENDKNLTKALEEAVSNYLYNFGLAQYLSIIHPSTGEKYPPIYGSTYNAQCAVIIGNIIGLCNLKRPAKASAKSYADMGYLVKLSITAIKAIQDERVVIKTATIKINDVVCANGSAEVDANKPVSYSVSAVGYVTVSKTITINEDTEMDVTLTQTPPITD